MKTLGFAGATLLACISSIAFAQTATTTPPKDAVAPAATPAPAAANEKPAVDAGTTLPKTADLAATPGAGMRQKLIANLQEAGFTDIKVVPDSFFVQAKDKLGEPVVMFLDANSITVLTTNDASGGAPRTTADATTKNADPIPEAHGMFTNVAAKDDLSSNLIGVKIYNSDKQNIGAIKDVAFSRNGVKAYIVGVGGFLGVGDRYVAVRPSAITLTYNAADKTWHAEMDTNAAQLNAAPEYKYAS